MYSVANELSAKLVKTDSVSAYDINEKLLNNIDKKRLNNSCVKGGEYGISVSDSYYDDEKDILYLRSNYTIGMPFNIGNMLNYEMGNSMVVRSFSGNRSVATHKVFVYVTKTGKVYHTDIKCTYLNVKKISVKKEDMDNYRNESGGKYYECKECDKEDSGKNVYITKYGTSYHNIKTCSSITRTIVAIDISEIKGRKKCEKCCR